MVVPTSRKTAGLSENKRRERGWRRITRTAPFISPTDPPAVTTLPTEQNRQHTPIPPSITLDSPRYAGIGVCTSLPATPYLVVG